LSRQDAEVTIDGWFSRAGPFTYFVTSLYNSTMPRETEIKLRLTNPKTFLRTLKKLGGKPVSPRVHEHNLIFDTPDGGLAKHGQLLRIRTETLAATGRKSARKSAPRTILTFKSPPDQLAIGAGAAPTDRRHKVREEIEVVLTDGASLKRIFEGLGLKGWFRYEKYRTAHRLPARMKWARELLIDFDETPIGTFVELEGPPDAIDQAARELGFSARDYVLKNYLVLYLEDCKREGVQPSDMLFSRFK
jgi:adenylate cyclase class 2